MKRILAAVALLIAGHAKAEPPGHGKLLEAIRQVENTPRHIRGRAGEVSDYQVLPTIWARYSDQPIYVATSHSPEAVAEQRRVAMLHLRWLARHVDNPTPYRLALAWTAGMEAVNLNNVSPRKAAYARRVCNVLETL